MTVEKREGRRIKWQNEGAEEEVSWEVLESAPLRTDSSFSPASV